MYPGREPAERTETHARYLPASRRGSPSPLSVSWAASGGAAHRPIRSASVTSINKVSDSRRVKPPSASPRVHQGLSPRHQRREHAVMATNDQMPATPASASRHLAARRRPNSRCADTWRDTGALVQRRMLTPSPASRTALGMHLALGLKQRRRLAPIMHAPPATAPGRRATAPPPGLTPARLTRRRAQGKSSQQTARDRRAVKVHMWQARGCQASALRRAHGYGHPSSPQGRRAVRLRCHRRRLLAVLLFYLGTDKSGPGISGRGRRSVRAGARPRGRWGLRLPQVRRSTAHARLHADGPRCSRRGG